jgi:peptidoglycan/xylan/chitin deacetylase (PgdA/CDA1 family)
MPSPPDHVVARRAQQRARIRRRRRVALAAAAVLLAVLVAGLVIVAGGGAAHSRRSRSLQAAVGVPASPRTAATGTVAGSGAREISARATAEIKHLIRIGLPIFCGGLHGDEVAFTFDDGPGVYTHYAVKKLTQAHEGATFFVVGRLIALWPGWLPQELKLGAIGDHTWTHPELIELSPSEIRSQLSMTAQAIHAASGENVDLWRSPYELHDAATDRIAQQLGLLQILWSVDSGDSVGANWAQIINNVEAGLKPGMIVLFHENRGQTIRALTTLLPELRRRHLRSVSIPHLLATDPPSDRQVREGLDACGTGGRQLLLGTGPGGGAGSGA